MTKEGETEIQKLHKDWARQCNDAIKKGAYNATELWLASVVTDPAVGS